MAALDAAIRGREWLHGNTLTLADICAGYALLYCDTELPKIAWRTRFPALASYAERLAARPSFRETAT
jgi:glutathione S-transferase